MTPSRDGKRHLRAMVGIVIASLCCGAAFGAEETVTSLPIRSFMSANVGAPVQGLIWQGGIEMQSPVDTFGGLSGIGFTDDDGQLVMVSDRGNFVSGRLIYDETGHPLSLLGVTIDPIRNSSGDILPRAFARDAEGLSVIHRDGRPAAIRVGFENLTRVADFDLVDGTPRGAAREITIPDWMSAARTNETLEAVCVAPSTSPIAGSTLLLPEGILDEEGRHRAFLLGRADRGPLLYVSGSGTKPTDCAFLPNGDLLVLERGISLIVFTMRLMRVPADEVKPGVVLEGEQLLYATGGDIDNMEGVATHEGPDGKTRITLISDNNFNDWERNLLLEFSLPE